MSNPSWPSVSWEASDITDWRADALAVVTDALQWGLAPGRWDVVRQALGALDAALAAGDEDALVAATADLEVAGPPRITRIGSVPVVPPPAPVRDLLNRLVYELGGTTAPGWERARTAEVGDGDVGDRR